MKAGFADSGRMPKSSRPRRKIKRPEITDLAAFLPYPKIVEPIPIDKGRERGLIVWTDLTKQYGPLASVDLNIAENRWHESRDPVAGLRVLLLCEAMSIYPPQSILKWLADAIEIYLREHGKRSIETLLLLTGSKGKKPAIVRLAQAGRKSAAAFAAYRLMHTNNLSGAQAAKRVASSHGYKPETIEREITKLRREYDKDKDLQALITGRRIHLAK
jgi:hypothetical protein